MKSVCLAALSTLLMVAVPSPSTDAAGLSGGLAVGVSADGKQLVAGGRNRALYELDAVTLEVKRRGYLGRQVQNIMFAPSGKTMIIESTKAVQWVAADTFKVLRTYENMSDAAAVPSAGVVAMNFRRRPYAITLCDIETGEEKAAIPYDSSKSITAFSVNQDGSRLAILYSRKKDESETKVERKDYPKDVKGAALDEFKQKNDGYSSQFIVYDVAKKTPILEKKIWFAGSGAHIAFWLGNDFYTVGYGNQNARIDAEGKVTFFALNNSYNYAKAVNGDSTAILSGGLRNGSRTTLPDMKSVTFKLESIDGWPEYFKGFSFADDGTGYGGTAGSRVVRFAPDGTVTTIKPVF